MEITFNYSLTAETLEKQANEKGYTFGANAEWVEKVSYGLKCAFMHECITDSEYKKIIGRFSEKVLAKRLKKLDGGKDK